MKPRLRIAIQKSGRLNNDSVDLLLKCGLKIRILPNALFYHVENFPVDILFVRDDDIPSLVMDGMCDAGIVGENVLLEQALGYKRNGREKTFDIITKLGFSRCRLSIAFPKDKLFENVRSLQNIRIATSYPNLLQDYLVRNNVEAEIMAISGSVEIAPRLGMADAICDLVATGRTLEENNLTEVDQVIESQAVLIKTGGEATPEKKSIFELLLNRIESVLIAQESKYIMLHAPKSSLPLIEKILPGRERPTIVPLAGKDDQVAVHVVSSENIFWTTLEELKQVGASSILVLPIEKILN